MAERGPNPRETLAVVLGASRFKRAPKLAQGRAFYNSAQDFEDYLKSSGGLGLPPENIDQLFDDTRSPSDQLQDIRDFLERRSTVIKVLGLEPRDLILYYVGHGLFSEDFSYYLAVSGTDERSEVLTSIRVSDLASIIKSSARFLRKFLILDCCFSASAYAEFQSGPLTAGRVKILEELPQRGTALLCSANAHDPALAPMGHTRTMFSDSLLRALEQGHPSLGARLSLSELGDLVKANLRTAYPDNWVRPEVHSPDQKEGDVAGLPLFPNVAHPKRQEIDESQPGLELKTNVGVTSQTQAEHNGREQGKLSSEGDAKPDFFNRLWRELRRRRPKVVILVFLSIVVAAMIPVGMQQYYSRARQPNVAQRTSPSIQDSHPANLPAIASPSVDLSERFVTYSVSGSFQRGFKLSSDSKVVIETQTGRGVAANVTVVAPDGTEEEFVGKPAYDIDRMWQWQGQGSLGGSLDFQDQSNTFVRYPGGYVLTNSAYDGPKSGGIITSSNTVFKPILASESLRP